MFIVDKMKLEKAVFAAGCFWGVEAEFRKIKGVVKTTVGYTGGVAKNPSYEDVCTGKTGHAESVLVEFDSDVVSYDELLDVFWAVHNPCSLNMQGLDIGTQYRSAIFYFNEAQHRKALVSKEKQEIKLKKKVVTEIVPTATFYRAEEYHQDYFAKHN